MHEVKHHWRLLCKEKITTNFSVLKMGDFSRHILVPREFTVETCSKPGALPTDDLQFLNIFISFNFKQALRYVKSTMET
jgi:hypothetical protein